MKRSILLALLSILFTTLQAQIISSDVTDLFNSQQSVDCVIEYADQWKAPLFIKSWNKDDKAIFVFEHLRAFSLDSQDEVIDYMLKEGISFQSYYVFNGCKARLTKKQLAYILDHFDVKSVAQDKSVPLEIESTRGTMMTQRLDVEWGIERIGADLVWAEGIEGDGVVVAGQDTGYDFDSPLIKDKYRGKLESGYDHNYNWHDAIHSLNPLHEDPDDNPDNNPCGLDSQEPCDDHNHGTHTMGTMVGQDEENGIGVAPKATWISCRNMDRGWGMPSTYTECFEWFLAPTDLEGMNPDPTKSPHVINNSWGCPEVEGCNPDNWMFMETVVDNLVDAGIVVVVSAGNDGKDGCSSINRPPSMFENAFAVGATGESDSIASFSSYGPVMVDSSGRWKPDIAAPGVNVRSILKDSTFASWAGTSMAGPHVAGAVALVINANPDLAGQVEEIEEILRNSAVPKTDDKICNEVSSDQVPNFVYGAGRLNVFEAVQLAKSWVGYDTVVKDRKNFVIYPNPTKGGFVITVAELLFTSFIFELYDVNGRKILIKELEGQYNSINIDAYSKGSYFYRIVGKHTIQTGKLIKQ